MKQTFIILVLFFFTSFSMAQDFEIGFNYDYANPTDLMGLNIDRSHGLSIQGVYHLPKIPRLSVGLDLAYAIYGSEKKQDLYMVEGGNSFNVDVNVKNNYALTNAFLRYDFLKNPGFIRPYATLGLGLSTFWTDLVVEDPNASHSFNDCPEPLETDVLIKDFTFNTTLGIGTQLDLGHIFNSLGKDQLLLNLQADYTLGGDITYMSLDASPRSLSNPRNSSEEIDVTYVDQMDPEVVHRYHVGNAYTTPLQMMRFRFGIVYKWQAW